MALIFFDGFDLYSTVSDAAARDDMMDGRWEDVKSAVSYLPTGGRFGKGAIQMEQQGGGTDGAILCLTSALTTGFVGVAIKINTGMDIDRNLIEFRDGPTAQTTLRFNNSLCKLEVVTGSGGAVIAAADRQISKGAWHYIEFKATIHVSAGVVTVRQDGVQVATASGKDTQETGNATFSKVFIGTSHPTTPGVVITYDDFYVADITGSAPNNDFLGDVRILSLYPTVDTADADWTRNTGADDFAAVDDGDAGPDDDTTYISSSTAAEKSLFDMTNLNIELGSLSPKTIFGLQTSVYARKEDAGTRTFKPVLKSNTTELAGATRGLTVDYEYLLDMYETDPDTSAAWTGSGVDAAKIGVEMVT